MTEQNQETALAVRDQNLAVAKPLTVTEIIAQVNLIQEVMTKVMSEGEHFGKIPGCGDKPTLLKAGAEKLKLTFRFAARYSGDDTPRDLGNGHREYIIKAELYTIGGNVFVGSGVGSCSTLEAKYRYRTGPRTPTEKPVPKAYWDLRQSDPKKAQEMLGGKGFGTMKDDNGFWVICEQGEKVEHDNPADYYNTVLKIAKKRADVDAVLSSTAASDIFTQDLDDMADNDTAPLKSANPKKEAPPQTNRPPRKKTDPNPEETAARLHDESNPELMPRGEGVQPDAPEDLKEGEKVMNGVITRVHTSDPKPGKKQRWGLLVDLGEGEPLWVNTYDSNMVKIANKAVKDKAQVAIIYTTSEYNGQEYKNLAGIRL